MMITKDYNNPKTITMISELNIGQWVRNPTPPPHSVLFRVRICLFPPFESKYLRTDKISEPPPPPPFAGVSQAFPDFGNTHAIFLTAYII